jgi:endonuclease YncB( thermonuclease family)
MGLEGFLNNSEIQPLLFIVGLTLTCLSICLFILSYKLRPLKVDFRRGKLYKKWNKKHLTLYLLILALGLALVILPDRSLDYFRTAIQRIPAEEAIELVETTQEVIVEIQEQVIESVLEDNLEPTPNVEDFENPLDVTVVDEIEVPDVINFTENGKTAYSGTVARVIDGDTIDVSSGGQVFRVRYVGMNTPERDEPCYREATRANERLLGREVLMIRDTSRFDVYGRYLFYIVSEGRFVNAELVAQGYAEVVSYPPDNEYYNLFRELELAADEQGLGCHPTGIFDDGTYRR